MKVAVTGASGFLAGHLIVQLLQRSLGVRGTVRSLQRADTLRATLQAAGVDMGQADFEPVVADLTSDAAWCEAFAGCDYVLHVASPFPGETPASDDAVIVPAREGTLRVLRAARDAGVRRVVMTSSFGAVGYGHPPDHGRFTERDWTNLKAPGLTAYIRSKTLAEQAAWSFVARDGSALELTVINPTGIFGPLLGQHLSASLMVVKGLLEGRVPVAPRVAFGVVDVRDAADLHLRALFNEQAAGQRFIAVSGNVMTMHQIAQVLRRRLGNAARRVPRFEAPDWAFRLLARFAPSARAVESQLGIRREASSEKAMQVLGWQPRSAEEAVLATAESLLAAGLIDR